MRPLPAPHLTIFHGPARPYLARWILFPFFPSGWPNVYLHRFFASDERTPHDHPWDFRALTLRGTGVEHRLIGGVERSRSLARWRRYRAETIHRIEIDGPVWTLIFHGFDRRVWGFWPTRGPGGDLIPRFPAGRRRGFVPHDEWRHEGFSVRRGAT